MGSERTKSAINCHGQPKHFPPMISNSSNIWTVRDATCVLPCLLQPSPKTYNPCANCPVALEAVMARLVALWRCQCGTRVKVVAEADSSRSARQMASCPKCRAPHFITADKIISVLEDTFDGSPAAFFCEEKERLLVAQSKALDVYARLVSEVA